MAFNLVTLKQHIPSSGLYWSAGAIVDSKRAFHEAKNEAVQRCAKIFLKRDALQQIREI